MASVAFASPAVKTIIRQRVGQVAALGMALGALVLLVALGTYHAEDPSLNTATALAPANAVGLAGSVAADVLLQFFGMAGGLPVLAMLAWAFRLAQGRPVRLGRRLVLLMVALPVLAAVLAAVPGPHGAAWPAGAGLGGAVGVLLGGWLGQAAQVLIGPMGAAVVVAAGAVLAVALVAGALGLSGGEWRAAGQGAVGVARGSVRGGRGAATAAGRVGGRVAGRGGALGRWMLGPVWRLLERGPEADEVAPLPPDPTRRDVRPEGLRREEAPREADVVAAPLAPVLPTVVPLPPVSALEGRLKGVVAKKPAVVARAVEGPSVENGWQFPPMSLLTAAPRREDSGPSEDALQANARLLETVLNDYGVQGAIREIRPGPVVTLYELEPAPGIRSARVIGLADDVARSLCVTAVRIATVPGRNVIGIEVPNAKRETVYLSELLGSEDWQGHPGKLALALGKDIGGTPVIADLARMPHLLIAGTTGSGKSVGINAMILSILFRMSPDQCRLIMIDPKMLELSVYEGIPHLLAPVVTEPAKAVTALKWATREMERRYRAMSQLGVRNVGGYNERVTEALARGEVVTRRVQTGFDAETGKPMFEEQPLALKPLPFIVVVIDEMADLMMCAGKEVEAAVQRLAQMARAAGIHVIMATQRPSVDVITGTIKANFPTRISFQVISKFDSRTILGEQGAEQLLGMGDLLHMAGGGRINRVHGPFVEDREVEDIVAFLRAQAEPTYDDEVTEGSDEDEPSGGGGAVMAGIDGELGLFDQAVAIVTREGKASTSFLQRHLAIGYNKAAKLIEQMEKEGVISHANHVGKREVLARVTRDDED